ncbi:L-lactate permease [Thermomicrobiaceae bacterium CFH 74404]|uniref:L-lactate permease n=1 Tax=Thermalbibacter longus TaxID=2951981 RepID=A0AA42BEC9_9BACT|nr:L-lactate permease [Thermalbibacter longus]MCM8750648.1 L-lactate permease [Thermalbibacter longus]
MTNLLALGPPVIAAVVLLRGARPLVAALLAYAAGVVLLTIFPTSLESLLRAEWLAFLTAVEVSAIILGGMALNELASRAGTTTALTELVRAAASERGQAVVLVVLGLTPFFESVTGFGVGAVIAVPLLRAAGLRGARLGVLALLGLVAVPWGALAPGTLVAARLAGVSFDELGTLSALLSLPVFLTSGVAALVIAEGWSSLTRHWATLLRGAIGLWVGIAVVNALLGTPLAGALGSLLAVAALALPALYRSRNSGQPLQVRGLAPYLALVGLLLAGRVASIAVAGWSAPLAAILSHPVLALGLTCAGLLLVHRDGQSLPAGWIQLVLRRWVPVALTTVAFVLLGGLMVASGMAAALARLATGLGSVYLLVAPWLGGLGGFVTGSNTGSNAMFASAQAQAASALGLPLLLVVAAQNVGASLLTMASPPRISLVLALLDPTERDASIGRTVLLVDLLALLGLSLALAAVGSLGAT